MFSLKLESELIMHCHRVNEDHVKSMELSEYMID